MGQAGRAHQHREQALDPAALAAALVEFFGQGGLS